MASDGESHETSQDTSVESGGESQGPDVEDVDIKKAKFFNTLSTRRKAAYMFKSVPLFYVLCIVLALSLFIFGLGLDLTKAGTTPVFGDDHPVTLSLLLKAVGAFLGFAMALDITIYYLSVYLLERVDFLVIVTFHTSGISTLLSFAIATFTAIGLMMWKGVKLTLSKDKTNLSILNILTTCLLALIFIIAKDVVVRNIRMGFNHTNYLARIQRCLLEQQFIRTLDVASRKIKGRQGRKSYWVFSNNGKGREQGEEREGRGSVRREKEERESKDKDILMSDSRSRDSGTRNKMVIFREFERLMNIKIFQKEGPSFSNDVRQYAKRKGGKMARRFSEDREKFTIRNLKKYVDGEYLGALATYLGIKEDVVLTEKEVSTVIEKSIRERHAIKRSLVHMDKALMRVSRIATLVVLSFAILALYSSHIEKNEIFTGVMATFFGAGFIFQSSAKNAIDSIIFLFLVHPYDIGDRVHIEIEKEIENMVVSELNVFSTVFYRWDGAKIYVPNHILLQKAIVNVRRSALMAENIKIQIDFDTSTEKIQHLKREIGKFLKKHPKDFTDYFMVNYEDLENTNKLHIKIFLQHNGNWQNYESYMQRRSKFIMFLKDAVEEQGITYHPPIHRLELCAGAGAEGRSVRKGEVADVK